MDFDPLMGVFMDEEGEVVAHMESRGSGDMKDVKLGKETSQPKNPTIYFVFTTHFHLRP